MRRSVVLTGASRGLGAALFDLFTEGGDRVLGLCRHPTDEQRRLADRRTEDVFVETADLTDPGRLPSVERLAAFLSAGGVPTLIHNAGVVTPIGPVGTLDPAAIETAVATNLLAPMLLTNAFLAALPAGADRADILFVSSGAARRIIDGWSVYSATKAGGENFFAAIADQYADDPRVRVASVNPGVMDTGMQADVRAATFAGQERFHQLHRAGELPAPADVARRIVAEHLS